MWLVTLYASSSLIATTSFPFISCIRKDAMERYESLALVTRLVFFFSSFKSSAVMLTTMTELLMLSV